jgi:hypothetical protein
MRKFIKQILKEEERNISALKNYFINVWNKQSGSGKPPRIPDWGDLKRKRLDIYFDDIKSWYLEFVGGEENAKKMLENYLNNITVTQNDFNKFNFNINPNDKFKIKITGVIDFDDPIYKSEINFGFYVIDGNFDTSDGQLSYNDLMDEQYDDIYEDVINWLRGELEGYVHTIGLTFGLDFTYVESQWND